MFGDKGAGGGVLVFQVTGISDGREKEVIREKFHVSYFNMRFETVDFNAGVVIDIGVFFLGDGKELLVVEPSFRWVSNRAGVLLGGDQELT